ncbi:MAG: hypothetical protein N3C12_07335 [Candidatus Binatia bacterium]|nr:hypothetical protein [Candidatus Binatia bacterium]
MWWRCIALGLALGAVVEAVAWLFRLWEFRRPRFAFAAIVLMYGIVMGSLAAQVPRAGWLVTFVVAALVGLAVELWNLQFGRWWTFPDGRDDHSRHRAGMLLVLALLWGIAPLAIAEGERELQRRWVGPMPPLVRLQQREAALQQRREMLLQRLQDVDHRLQDVQRRRRRLERKLGPLPQTPAREDVQ